MLKKYAPAIALLWAISGSALAAEAGRIVFVTGQVQLGRHAAAQDAAVQEGDQISTGADGYVYVKTVDNGFLILRPNSTARVVAYAIDEKDPSKTQVKLELSQGVARTISGQGVKQARQNFRFNTPVAAIGVRGTDFTVYTDQQTTRVAVLSGGVVVSGFSATCSAAGTGPCEGRDARELFAGQVGVLLQVERDNQIPQLLQSPAVSPDGSGKPRADEPGSKQAAAAPVAQVNLDPKRSDSLSNARPAPVVPPGPPDRGPMTPPPIVIVEPGPPASPAPQEIFWGRWQEVAGVPAKPGRIDDVGMDVPIFYPPYAITRVNNSALVMPTEGTAAFKLEGGEALMTGADYDRIATIESGSLSMDFSKRTFATSLLVKANNFQVDVKGTGVVTNKGMLYEDSSSDTIIRGYLGGPKAEQAGYIFKNSATPGITVHGATLWSR